MEWNRGQLGSKRVDKKHLDETHDRAKLPSDNTLRRDEVKSDVSSFKS